MPDQEKKEKILGNQEKVVHVDHKEGKKHSKEQQPEATVKNQQEEVLETPFSDDPMVNKTVVQLIQQVEENQKQMEEMEKQIGELYEQFMRARADLENYRRRAKKEKEEALKYANVPLLESLLPVLDNFERALEASDQTAEVSSDAKAIKQGIEMVYRQFLQVLHAQGLELIDALGKPFNPHEHNAVMQVETDEVEPGIVIEELQAGYRFQDRVIRPTVVKVSS